MGDFDLPPPGPSESGYHPRSVFDLPEDLPPLPAPAQAQPPQTLEQQIQDPEDEAKRQQAEALAARQAKLQQEHGVLGTVSGQFARGVFDALLAPGALVGAAAQSYGELADNKTISDFGRDLGRASSGKSAVESLGYIFGGGGEEGLERSDLARKRVEEQEEARPMLSTVSRMAGQAFAVMTAGSGAVGESGVAANIGLNVGEGAAAGAQGAYERSASLRDVLASAAVGGILGGAISGAGEAVSYGAKKIAQKAPDLAEVFGEKLGQFADVSEIKSWTGSGKKFWKNLGMDDERIARVAEKLRGVEKVGEGDAGMLEGLDSARSKAASELTQVEDHLNTQKIAPDFEKLVARTDEQIAKLRDAGTGSANNIADRLESEIAPLKQKLMVSEATETAPAIYKPPTFTELRNFKTSLGDAHEAAMQTDKYIGTELRKLYGSVGQTLDEAADSAGPGVGKLWKRANETYSDLTMVRKQMVDQVAAARSNRWMSPSDYGTSIGMGLATLMHTANPIAAAATALGSGIAHHAFREGGRAIFATMANRFARTVARFRPPTDVGPEMSEVLEHLAKTKQFVAETAARAGDNPTAIAAASDAASNVAAGVAAKKAGALDVATWADKPLSPMQKVLYRGQILDRVSKDLSDEAGRLADSAPTMPPELDARRISRLTRDADGPAAIGGVQQSVADLIDNAPPTPTGYAAGVALRQLSEDIESADLPAVMTRTHAITRTLDDLSGSASDQPSRDFAQRAMVELQSKLGSDSFGAAGKQYAAMTARPSQFLENLYNQDALREALRVSDATGEFPKRLAEAQQMLSDAHDAAFKLAGQKRPPELSKAFARGQKLFKSAEDAVTLDGSGMNKLFDAANRAGVYAGDQTYLHTTDVGDHTVRDTVDEQIGKLAPVIKAEAGIKSARYRPMVATSVAARKAAAEDPQAQYNSRLEKLNAVVADPTQIKGGMYAGIGPDVGGKLAQLLADMPKPTKSLMGPAGSQLSSEDLRLASAMWDATTKPLSVFDDFARGAIDYDKVNYAWKQYPGLQEASQAGALDFLTHDLDEEERGKVPQSMISQLDNLLGFNGKLQESLNRDFSARMSQMYQPEANKPQPGGTLDTPKAEPTYTQRIANGAGQ